MSQQEKKETPKNKKRKIVSTLKHEGKNFLIVDIKKRNPEETVLYVSHWGKLLEKGEAPTEEHVFKVKEFRNKKFRKVYDMTKSATTGKFKVIEKN